MNAFTTTVEWFIHQDVGPIVILNPDRAYLASHWAEIPATWIIAPCDPS